MHVRLSARSERSGALGSPVRRLRRAGLPHTRRAGYRVATATRWPVARGPGGACAPVALLQLAQWLAQPATARALARARIAPTAAGAVVVRRAVVVTKAEEP